MRYIIVGGFATNFHGYKRATGDIDFWMEDTIENRKNLILAVEGLGFGRFDELLHLPLLAGYCEIMLDNGIYADLMGSILGFEKEDFDGCYKLSIVSEVDGVPLRFLHLNHLLKSKSGSHRPKDQLDAEQLKRLKGEDG